MDQGGDYRIEGSVGLRPSRCRGQPVGKRASRSRMTRRLTLGRRTTSLGSHHCEGWQYSETHEVGGYTQGGWDGCVGIYQGKEFDRSLRVDSHERQKTTLEPITSMGLRRVSVTLDFPVKTRRTPGYPSSFTLRPYSTSSVYVLQK